MSALGGLYQDDDSETEESERREPEGDHSEETVEAADDDEDSEQERSKSDREDEDSDKRGSDNDSDGEGRDRDESEQSDEKIGSDTEGSNHNDNDGYGRDSDSEEPEVYVKRDSDSEEGHEDEKDDDDDDDVVDDSSSRNFEVYGDLPPEDFVDEPDDPEQPVDRGPGGGGDDVPNKNGGSTGMSSSQTFCTVCCCLICIILALIGGAVIGALLTDSDSSFRDVLGIDDGDVACRDEGLGEGPPKAVFTCPEDNVALEVRIIFDAKPGDVGLKVEDDFGVKLWNFPPMSFASFALLLRENIFTLCLSPFQNYTLEFTDVSENGFISSLGADIYGSFSLIYDDELVTTYDGDCDDPEKDPIECGNFCKCTYLLAVNASGGSCTTTC